MLKDAKIEKIAESKNFSFIHITGELIGVIPKIKTHPKFICSRDLSLNYGKCYGGLKEDNAKAFSEFTDSLLTSLIKENKVKL